MNKLYKKMKVSTNTDKSTNATIYKEEKKRKEKMKNK